MLFFMKMGCPIPILSIKNPTFEGIQNKNVLLISILLRNVPSGATEANYSGLWQKVLIL